jgi:hypothetical protein
MNHGGPVVKETKRRPSEFCGDFPQPVTRDEQCGYFDAEGCRCRRPAEVAIAYHGENLIYGEHTLMRVVLCKGHFQTVEPLAGSFPRLSGKATA